MNQGLARITSQFHSVGTKYGYARVSKDGQNPGNAARSAGGGAGCRQTFTDEEASGAVAKRLPYLFASMSCSLATP